VNIPRLRQFFATALPFALLVLAMLARAQEKPLMEIDRDCESFAVSSTNRIVCSVPRLKRMKKVIIQRADVWVANEGKEKLIVEGEKFMPVPPPQSFQVDSLAWSPDGSRIAMSITTQKPTSDEDSPSGGKAIALLDDEGHEIKVEGSKTRFVEEASHGTWLADNVNVAYLIGAGPYKIGRVSVVSGQSSTLFEGHTFDAIVWDAPRNQAYALSQNLSVSGRQALFQLDLVHEGIREVTRIDAYQGGLNLSSSGTKLAFFTDGDAVEVLDLAHAAKPLSIRVGMGTFAWSRDERRILLKRGPPEKSGELIWVGLYDGTFTPALHGLEYHAFAISPNGETIAVTEPGKEILRVYPLQ
jgi:Tol biopolymer transport system component